MGKGDQRTRRGKLYRGTFGKSRPHKAKKKTVAKPMSAVARAAARRQSRKAAAPSGE